MTTITQNKNFIDLTGQVYNRLTVLEWSHKRGATNMWKCQCLCGKFRTVGTGDLRAGHTKSCGCFKKDFPPARRLPDGEAAFGFLLNRYRKAAQRRNLQFALTREQFRELTLGNCHYCGLPPAQVMKPLTPGSGPYIHNGVDRVDSSMGYNWDNCVSCCGPCNVAKLAMSREDFLEWVFRVADYQRLKQEQEVQDGDER